MLQAQIELKKKKKQQKEKTKEIKTISFINIRFGFSLPN
jgi:hypothetical protein